MSRPLRELEGEITTVHWPGRGWWDPGVRLLAVMFVCPVCPGPHAGHAHVIPYADEPFHELPDPRCRPGGISRAIKVWQRVSGSTVDDITLAPSYLVPSCGGFHGYVRAGRWEDC